MNPPAGNVESKLGNENKLVRKRLSLMLRVPCVWADFAEVRRWRTSFAAADFGEIGPHFGLYFSFGSTGPGTHFADSHNSSGIATAHSIPMTIIEPQNDQPRSTDSHFTPP